MSGAFGTTENRFSLRSPSHHKPFEWCWHQLTDRKCVSVASGQLRANFSGRVFCLCVSWECLQKLGRVLWILVQLDLSRDRAKQKQSVGIAWNAPIVNCQPKPRHARLLLLQPF